MKYILIPFFLIITLVVKSQSYEIDAYNGQTVNTCAGTFYDSGGSAGTYQNYENYSVTFCTGMPGSQIIFTFTSFNAESATFDHLNIYDGPNASSPMIGNYGSTSLNGSVISSSNGCLTFTWVTDGSVTYAGWSATISCSFPCQEWDLTATPSVPFTSGDTIKVCQDQPITFTATGNYYNNNINYTQSDATSTFSWDFGDGSAVQTGASVTHTFPDGGGYFVIVNGADVNSCDNQNFEQIIVMVSTTPTFVGTGLDPDTICLGEQVDLSGFVQTQPWEQTVPPPWAGLTHFDDSHYQQIQSAPITFGIFAPGATLTNVNDILSVCAEMEHSYLGDLTIYLTCPNGSSVNFVLYPNGCGGTYLGVPIDVGGDTDPPGTGWMYCWSPTPAVGTMSSLCGGYYGTGLPANTYSALDPWTNLLGCPLNGDWSINITDNLYSDDGFIFQWTINFNPAIIPTNLWEYQNTYSTSDVHWTGDNIVSDNNYTATAEPTSDGDVTYQFNVIDDFGCPYDTTVTVHVLPAGSPGCCVMPDAEAGPDDEICSLSYPLVAVMSDIANTGEWTYTGPGTAVFSNVNSPTSTVTVSTYGMYTFTWTEINSVACENPDDVKITFYPTPTSTFTYTPIMCFGETTTLTYTGTGTAGANYTWNFDGATSTPTGQGPHSIGWAVADTYTVTLTVDENGCTSTSTSQNIVHPEELISSIGAGNIECPGEFTSVGIDVDGGTTPFTYSWDPDPGPITSIGPGTYNLTITDANGCTNTHTFTITEPPDFVYQATPVNLTCYHDNTGSVAIDYTGGTLPYVYSWSGPSGFSASSEDVSGIGAGTYNLQITDASGCTLTDAIVITEPAQLVATIISSEDVSCFGVCDGTANTSITGGTVPYTYLWNNGITTANNSTLCVGTNGILVTDSHGCTAGVTVVTTEPALFTSSIVGTNVSCFGGNNGTITLTPTGGTFPYSYNWNPAMANSGFHSAVAANSYLVTVTDMNGCTTTNNITITQPATPISVTFSQVDLSCFGGNTGEINISVSGGSPGYTYFWSNGLSSEDVVNLGAGTYSVTVTDTHNCTFITGTTIIQPSQLVLTASVDKWICIDSDVTINASTTGGTPPYSYTWSNGVMSASQTVGPVEDQIYTVSVTDVYGCPSNIENVTVFVFDSLKMNLTSQDFIICSGEQTNILSSFAGGNGGPYILSIAGMYINNPHYVSPTETTTYTVTLQDFCTTPAITQDITITVINPPSLTFTWDDPDGCQPHTVQFNAMSGVDYVTYSWDFGDAINNYSFLPNPIHTYEEDGLYDVTLHVIDTVNGCETITTYEDIINVYPLPVANFVPDPGVTSIINPDIYFVNLSQLNDINLWDFGDGDSSDFVCPSHPYREPGTYEIQLIVITNNGCRDTTTGQVIIKDEYTFYAPTAFSPNKVEPNEKFFVIGEGIDPENFQMMIYDRWGELIYETDKYNPDKPDEYGWDGRVKENKFAKNEVYTWLVIYLDLRGNQHEEAGTVTVIR